MSAASLADERKELLDRSDQNPSEESLQTAFRNYQISREEQTRFIAELANMMQRMEALDDQIMKYMQLYRIPNLRSAEIVNSMSLWYAPSIRLRHLPLPSRQGILASEYEVKIKAQKRSTLANLIWILLLALVMLFHFHFHLQRKRTPDKPVFRSSPGSLEGPPLALLHFHVSVSVVNTIICIESYRKFFFMKPVGRYVMESLSALLS